MCCFRSPEPVEIEKLQIASTFFHIVTNDDVQIRSKGCATSIPMTQRVRREQGHLTREKTSKLFLLEQGLYFRTLGP
jgi:hypothetical protein